MQDRDPRPAVGDDRHEWRAVAREIPRGSLLGLDRSAQRAPGRSVLAFGSDGLDWLVAHSGVDAMAVTDDGQVFITSGFDCQRSL